MIWHEIQVGDVLEHDEDLLLVLVASDLLIQLVNIDVRSWHDVVTGEIEVWERLYSVNTVVGQARLVWRDESVFPR